MNQSSRYQFCSLLARHRGVSITPAMLDLSVLSRDEYEQAPRRHAVTIPTKAAACVHQTMRDQMETLARQTGNLSPQAFMRMLAWTKCVQWAIEYSVLFFSARRYDSAWQATRFYIDAVQVRQNNREERFLEFMLPSWFAAWSRTTPLPTIKEIHTPDHPFVTNFTTDDGIDLGKILRGNVLFRSSRDVPGLQIADVAAAIVRDAVHDLDDRRGHLPVYGALMQSSFYGPAMGPGLFHVKHGEFASVPAPRFAPLNRYMHDMRALGNLDGRRRSVARKGSNRLKNRTR